MVDFSAVDAAVLAALGEDVSYQRAAGGSPLTVRAVFQAPAQPIQRGDVAFEGTGPRFLIHEDDFVGTPPVHNDEITRDSVVFVVKGPIQKDEGALYVLFCKRKDV